MRRVIPASAVLVLAIGLAAAVAPPAHSYVNPGDAAPNFTKNELIGPPWAAGPSRTLASYPGKVIVLFLLGST